MPERKSPKLRDATAIPKEEYLYSEESKEGTIAVTALRLDPSKVYDISSYPNSKKDCIYLVDDGTLSQLVSISANHTNSTGFIALPVPRDLILSQPKNYQSPLEEDVELNKIAARDTLGEIEHLKSEIQDLSTQMEEMLEQILDERQVVTDATASDNISQDTFLKALEVVKR